MAQMIRAILLNRTIAATLRGRRSSNCNSQAVADLLPGLAKRITDIAPTTSSCRNLSLPALLIFPVRCLPPVECSRGVSPSQAAKCRPVSKFAGFTVNAIVIAVIGPTPGIAARSLLTALAFCCSSSCFSSTSIGFPMADSNSTWRPGYPSTDTKWPLVTRLLGQADNVRLSGDGAGPSGSGEA